MKVILGIGIVGTVIAIIAVWLVWPNGSDTGAPGIAVVPPPSATPVPLVAGQLEPTPTVDVQQIIDLTVEAMFAQTPSATPTLVPTATATPIPLLVASAPVQPTATPTQTATPTPLPTSTPTPVPTLIPTPVPPTSQRRLLLTLQHPFRQPQRRLRFHRRKHRHSSRRQ